VLWKSDKHLVAFSKVSVTAQQLLSN